MDLASRVLELIDDLATDILERDVIHCCRSDAGDLFDGLVMFPNSRDWVRVNSASVRPPLFFDEKRDHHDLEEAIPVAL